MSKSANPVITLAVVSGLAYGLFKLSQKHLQQTFANLLIQPRDISLHGDMLEVVFNIQNPNSQPLIIKAIFGTLFLNNVKVANVNSIGNYVIPAANQKTLPVLAKPDLLLLGLELPKLLKIPLNVNMQFVGTINVNDQAVPLKLTYAFHG